MAHQRRNYQLAQAVERHEGQLLAAVKRLVRDQVEAEDIVQETFEELVGAYDLDHAFEALGAWLYRVAKNKVIDRFRRRTTVREHEREAIAESANARDSLFGGPEHELSNSMIREAILDGLAELPPEQRDVFIMHEIEGKSFEEIAGLTGANVNTLLSRKRYAIEFLRTYLKEVLDGLE